MLYELASSERKKRISTWAMEDTRDVDKPVAEKVFLTGAQVQSACLHVVCALLHVLRTW